MNGQSSRPMLEIVDLLHQYGSSVVVDHVSLTVAGGEFLTILGESGSGKTTMLRMIAGLERPTARMSAIFRQPSAIAPPYSRITPSSRTCRWAKTSPMV